MCFGDTYDVVPDAAGVGAGRGALLLGDEALRGGRSHGDAESEAEDCGEGGELHGCWVLGICLWYDRRFCGGLNWVEVD